MENEVQVDQNVEAQQTPSLEGVEIVSNGTVIDTSNDTQTQQEDNANNNGQQQQEQEQQSSGDEFQQVQSEMQQAKEELQSKSVNYSELEAEYEKNGELSEDSYAKLEKAGYGKDFVKMVIAGWEAKADAFVNKVIDNAGGKAEFEHIQKFVSEQGKGAVDAFNEIIENSSLSVVSAYINGIKAQMVTKYGTSNPSLGGSTATNGVAGFQSSAEMVKAMSDPRYGNDAKYTHEVEQKVAKATFF